MNQTALAKELDITSVMLSNWELNRKPPPPKYLTLIIGFLGYTPQIKLSFDRLGTYTQLFRIDSNISLAEFFRTNRYFRKRNQTFGRWKIWKTTSSIRKTSQRIFKTKPYFFRNASIMI